METRKYKGITYRLFQGKESSHLLYTGQKVQPEAWYCDFPHEQSVTLWSEAGESINEADDEAREVIDNEEDSGILWGGNV